MNGPHDIDDVIGNRYRVNSFIGEGGMQYVYQAADLVLDRLVALKTPKEGSAEKRFHRSAIVAARVNHPNVAKTLDYIYTEERPYLVEELVHGQDLKDALLTDANYLDPFLVAKIAHHFAKGLAASHHANVIHRDLKPTNVMITGGFNILELKITDFGIAKMAEEEIADAASKDITNSTSATVVGALPYMAPEAIETPRDISLKADIWSMGAMLYELLTGQKPFGAGLKAVRLISEGKFFPFPDFVTTNPQFRHLAKELISLIKQCLSVDPVDRPSADQVVATCETLCYPVSEREFGNIKDIRFDKWGFITQPNKQDTFYHVNSVYGKKPIIGSRVMYSKYPGSGADRALPVVKLK
ncbi:MAG: serine/threonine protein kinase [Idiomarina sp.]|nr:serine/threonine protein kinase [Idiomarina sp.]